MKRNRFGINLDEGIPLLSEEEFELLYVPCFGEVAERLLSWLKQGDKPLLLGGQVGSGKSTLISKAIQESCRTPDVTLHFDQEAMNLDAGDFWSIALSGLLEAAFAKGVDLDFCKLPAELGPYHAEDWQSLLEGLRPQAFSMASFKTKATLRKKVADNAAYIGKITTEIGRRLQAVIGKPLLIFASGLDKFDPRGTASLAMQDIVLGLSDFKTLFEVNAAHLFQKQGSPLYSLDRLFILVFKEDAIVEILSRRMGVYAQPIRRELSIIAPWSGGNPRQAIRILDYFETARKKRKRNTVESLTVAIRETTSDFFAYSPKPSADLIKTIRRTGTINATMFSLPGDKDTALRALYGNWIFLSGKTTDTSWSVMVNPLVKMAFEERTVSEEPEVTLLFNYATVSGISPSGLSPRIPKGEGSEEGSADQILWDFLAAGVEYPVHTNLSETLDVLGDALLSRDRADRVILAYKDANVTKAARAYLFAKANSYEYQRCKHVVITGGPEKNPLEEIEACLAEDTDIFSLEFAGQWESAQLEALDKQRDRFFNLQMLWWIPLADLEKYLPYWRQLRQLFELFVLEDELLGSISREEVRADLEFFEDLVENGQSAEANIVANLRIVLDYIKKTREGANHE